MATENDLVLQAMDASGDFEGMEDLGTLVRDTIAIRVKSNGTLLLQKNWVCEDGPGLHAWSYLVRYANAHGATHELLSSLDGEANAPKDDGPTMPDGRPMTLKNLEGMHPKKLAVMAKGFSIDPKGKSVKILAAEIMARVNTEDEAHIEE